ncbi:MAG: DUF1858 domain-containing protein [Oscillospiraceae bacterium]|nr:DUF1858 domain-containing protein [Oscillospiraceae bacterium]
MPDITKNTVIGEVLATVPGISAVFAEVGMHCLRCGSAQMETIEEACMVHGIDVEILLDEIDAHIALQEDFM